VYSLEGTLAHAVAERCLWNRQDAIEYVGRRLLADDGAEVWPGHEVTPDMAEAVQVYLDECRRVDVLPGDTLIEARIDLAPLNPPAPIFGTADFVAYIPGWHRLRVIDLKYGAGVRVEAEGNAQLKHYALGALLRLDQAQQ